MKFNPDDFTRVRNHSGRPIEEVIDVLDKNGMEIQFGKVTMACEIERFNRVRREVADVPHSERDELMANVERSLKKYESQIINGNASKLICDNFHTDLMIWEALRRLRLS